MLTVHWDACLICIKGMCLQAGFADDTLPTVLKRQDGALS